MAKVWRKLDLGDGNEADPRIGHFVADEFLEFLPDGFGQAFITVGVHVESGKAMNGRQPGNAVGLEI